MLDDTFQLQSWHQLSTIKASTPCTILLMFIWRLVWNLIFALCCYDIAVEKVLGSQWATKFCDWMAMANNAWRHKQGELY